MIAELERYFELLLDVTAQENGGLPAAPWDPGVEEWFWQGPPDDEEWAPWRPVRKTVTHDLDALAPDVAPWPPSLAAYANSFWFAALDGSLGEYRLTLKAVLPGPGVNNLVRAARNFAGTGLFPIGIENQGFTVVVDRADGSVQLIDPDDDSRTTLAPDLAELIGNLTL